MFMRWLLAIRPVLAAAALVLTITGLSLFSDSSILHAAEIGDQPLQFQSRLDVVTEPTIAPNNQVRLTPGSGPGSVNAVLRMILGRGPIPFGLAVALGLMAVPLGHLLYREIAGRTEALPKLNLRSAGQFLRGLARGVAITVAVIVGITLVIGIAALVAVAFFPATAVMAVVGGLGAIGLGAAGVISFRKRQHDADVAGLPPSRALSLHLVMAAVGDVVGVSAISEGVRGRRLFSNAPLGAGERGELVGAGLLQTALSAFVAVKGVLALSNRAVVTSARLAMTEVRRVASTSLMPASPPKPTYVLSTTGQPITAKYTAETLAKLKSAEASLARLLPRGIKVAEFHKLRLKPTERLTPGQAARLKYIRERIAPIGDETIMQKAIPPEQVAKYFSGEWQAVRGFVARGQDVAMLRSRDAIVEGKALLYPGNKFAGTDVLYLLRFRARSANKYQIPYGGNNHQGQARMGGQIQDHPPFTGNGFTASKQRTVPEVRIQGKVPLMEGTELYRIEGNRPEVLVGLYTRAARRVVEISEVGGEIR